MNPVDHDDVTCIIFHRLRRALKRLAPRATLTCVSESSSHQRAPLALWPISRPNGGSLSAIARVIVLCATTCTTGAMLAPI
jgi:hypothetical protein